jgi:hypothetical protein
MDFGKMEAKYSGRRSERRKRIEMVWKITALAQRIFRLGTTTKAERERKLNRFAGGRYSRPKLLHPTTSVPSGTNINFTIF